MWRLTLVLYVETNPASVCGGVLFSISETLVSDMRHVSEILVPGCLGPEGWLHTYEMVTEHFANPNFSVVVAK